MNKALIKEYIDKQPIKIVTKLDLDREKLEYLALVFNSSIGAFIMRYSSSPFVLRFTFPVIWSILGFGKE